jgi:hypothetical protein
MRASDPSAATSSFTHRFLRLPNTTTRSRAAKLVLPTSATNCASCECVREAKYSFGVAA